MINSYLVFGDRKQQWSFSADTSQIKKKFKNFIWTNNYYRFFYFNVWWLCSLIVRAFEIVHILFLFYIAMYLILKANISNSTILLPQSEFALSNQINQFAMQSHTYMCTYQAHNSQQFRCLLSLENHIVRIESGGAQSSNCGLQINKVKMSLYVLHGDWAPSRIDVACAGWVLVTRKSHCKAPTSTLHSILWPFIETVLENCSCKKKKKNDDKK